MAFQVMKYGCSNPPSPLFKKGGMASARFKSHILEPPANYSIYFKLGYYNTRLTFGTDGAFRQHQRSDGKNKTDSATIL